MDEVKRSWAIIYNDLLRYQAELSCDLEQLFFRSSSAWVEAKTILDFGAGNAYYSNLLAQRNPDKYFLCVEKNADLAKIDRQEITCNRVEVVTGSFEDIGSDKNFDFVFARHVLSYLSERDRLNFSSWVAKNISGRGTVLIIDADDDAFLTYPELPLLEGGNEKFKEELHEGGGNRALREELPQYWIDKGFRHQVTRPLVVHSSISGRKYLMALFMKSVAEIDHGSPLPDEVRNEIDEWTRNRNSYLQYGLFGSLFTKEG